ncbi:MAG TPA: DUF72 domain-containing protein [Alphaproteobacteria bacterium]|nr:DUF72 domain-containing protein [Alphaproteobacteria bacterium]
MSADGQVRIGLSGWNYPEWKDSFYAGVKRKDWFAHAAGRFDTLEVNATFYREQKPSTLEHWRETVPEDFVFAIKGHRYLTHTLKLADAEDSLARQRENAKHLGSKLAAVLWQLPPSLKADHGRLEVFLSALGDWTGVRHAIEFRHASWFEPQTERLLNDAGIANCVSDAARWPRWDAVTGPLVYLRLHGRPETYVSAYGAKGLRPWQEKIQGWRKDGRDVLVYFDNDAAGAAFVDAEGLMKMCGKSPDSNGS